MRNLLQHALIGLLVAQAGCALSSLEETSPDPLLRETWQSHMESGDSAAEDHRFEAAEREFLAAAGSITTLSGNERLLLTTLRRLARLYADGGRPDAAESVLKKALAFSEKTLGAEHPETMKAM